MVDQGLISGRGQALMDPLILGHKKLGVEGTG